LELLKEGFYELSVVLNRGLLKNIAVTIAKSN
jgi:hypothetical protein